MRAVIRRVVDLVDQLGGAAPGGRAGAVLLLGLAALVVVAVRLRLGPVAGSARQPGVRGTGRPRSAAEHRAAADRLAAGGRYAEAVRERLRAVVGELEDRSLIDAGRGRTAGEVAAAAAAAAPVLAAGMWDAAGRFAEIWYGGRAAGPADDTALRSVDDAVRTLRDVDRADGPGGSTSTRSPDRPAEMVQ